ncbi:hypothetical protein [Candidatus Nanohalobium constans]|nr:hypothetical protein [Candidatus Nanohalobium constans]
MALCDYCQEKKAVTKCEVCGSMICDEHKLEYGCKVCDGVEQKI